MRKPVGGQPTYASQYGGAAPSSPHPDATQAQVCKCERPNAYRDESDGMMEVRCLSCGREVKGKLGGRP